MKNSVAESLPLVPSEIRTKISPKKIAIVGLPNTGKSHVFNRLTGEYTIVANYPLTTVEIKKGRSRINSTDIEVFDTPGLHSLYIHSEEEILVRTMLLTQRPDVIIQCIDANQVRQSLALTADLMELQIPMVLVLNAIEETVQKGIQIQSQTLSQILNVGVVALHNLHDRASEKLKRAIEQAGSIKEIINYGEEIEKGIASVESLLPETIVCRRKISILLLQEDPFIAQEIKNRVDSHTYLELMNTVASTRRFFSRSNICRRISNKRNAWVDEICEKVVKIQKQRKDQILQHFAHLSRHPFWGLPILTAFVAVTYLCVVHIAGYIEGILSGHVVDPIVAFLENNITVPWIAELLVGHYGVLTLGLFNAFCTVLPILSVFFLLFGALEDSGYIPNLCVLTNRLFQKIGITGKSIMPMVLGFGCKTMATLTTRGLSSKKEKYIAIYLIAFAIPCSAQLGLNMAILGKMGIYAFIIAFAALAGVEIFAGAVLNRILKEDKKSDFIQELPPIRIPNIKAVVVKTYYRLVWFLREAVPIFVIAAIALFLFDKSGGLEVLKTIFSPVVVGWLGLPIDIVEALILVMARHEAAAGLLLKMVNAGQLNWMQSIVAVVITTMFVPCFANIVAMCKETSVKVGLLMALAINISSFFLAGMLRWVLEFIQ